MTNSEKTGRATTELRSKKLLTARPRSRSRAAYTCLVMAATMLAAGCGLVIHPGDREVAAGLQEHGSRVVLNKNGFVIKVDMEGSEVTAADLVNLSEFLYLTDVYLNGTAVTDEWIAEIPELPNLSVLMLNDTQLTDEAIEALAQFKSLDQLYLKNTLLSRRGVKKLRQQLGDTAVFYSRATPSAKKTPTANSESPQSKETTSPKSDLPAVKKAEETAP